MHAQNKILSLFVSNEPLQGYITSMDVHDAWLLIQLYIGEWLRACSMSGFHGTYLGRWLGSDFRAFLEHVHLSQML